MKDVTQKSVVFHIVLHDKRWRIAARCGAPGHRWAWLVNIVNPMDQVRLSMKHPSLAPFDNSVAA